MNVRYEESTRAYVVPDPWSRHVGPRPGALRPYFQFVQRNVLDHTKGLAQLHARDYLRFVTFMIRHGLSLGTMAAAARQIAAERLGGQRWKRVTLLDRLQFDVFSSYYRRLRPAFSTFFLNSTAHYQHAYWDAFQPERYPGRALRPGRERYRSAILYGYQQMDVMIGRFFRLAGDQATLILCTALSQEPDVGDRKGDRAYYRITDVNAFADALHLDARCRIVPVMTDQYHFDCESLEQRERLQRALSTVTFQGNPLLRARPEGETRLFVSCNVRSVVGPDAAIRTSRGEVPFASIFYNVPTTKVADHHPDGVLWIRRPDGGQPGNGGVVPLTAVAPTILRLFGITQPAHMKGPALSVAS
jgi:hypothetical protein